MGFNGETHHRLRHQAAHLCGLDGVPVLIGSTLHTEQGAWAAASAERACGTMGGSLRVNSSMQRKVVFPLAFFFLSNSTS